MTSTQQFADVLEAADRLTDDEQHELVAILQRRMAEAGRRRVVADVLASRQEFAAGNCTPATPAEIMQEVLR